MTHPLACRDKQARAKPCQETSPLLRPKPSRSLCGMWGGVDMVLFIILVVVACTLLLVAGSRSSHFGLPTGFLARSRPPPDATRLPLKVGHHYEPLLHGGGPAPIVTTLNRLASDPQKNGSVQAHGQLAKVVQWQGYPFAEEAVAGILRTALPKQPDKKLDEWFQEYIEDRVPVLGGIATNPRLLVLQRQDSRRSQNLPPAGPSLRDGHVWADGAWKRNTVGFEVEGVKLLSEDTVLTLYQQDMQDAPFFTCSGNGCSYTFSTDDRGRWYIAVATPKMGPPEIHRLWVSFPRECSFEPFSRKELSCVPEEGAKVQENTLAQLADLLEGDLSTPQVSFGIEIGSWIRMPVSPQARPEQFAAVLKYFSGDSSPEVYDKMQSLYDPETYDQDLRNVSACFNTVTKNLFREWKWESTDIGWQDDVDDPLEMWGLPYQLVGPDPPNMSGASGVSKTLQVVSGLWSMGTQSQDDTNNHLHLFVRQSQHNTAGDWTDREIARLWIGWAVYQYAIDQMLPSPRAQNNWAQGLYSWDPKIQFVFRNIHRLVSNGSLGHVSPSADLCDKILGQGECDSMSGYWPSKHTPFRYYAINFAALFRFGSVEVRSFTSSTQPVRYGRWLDFVLRAADAFRHDASLDRFLDEGADNDFTQLHDMQARASIDGLFAAVKLPRSSQDFYTKRLWAKTDKGEWQKGCSAA